MNHIPTVCPLCNGKIKPGTTTFSLDLQSGVIVVRKVPAHICQQCGEEWLDDEQAANLEKIVARARQQNVQLEMVSMG
ncbi:MAG: type II toxin-antitoxin system MqsA family antitoxin [Saprospiraceae bacterium]|jgi:YgiT-type zinc finger domain-containing protein|nr:type II toxin-antitoxin system MqsA family antitoxin [Saprospiraceae bacterium]